MIGKQRQMISSHILWDSDFIWKQLRITEGFIGHPGKSM